MFEPESINRRGELRRTPSPLGGEGWGEGDQVYRVSLPPSPDAFHASTSPPRGEVKREAVAPARGLDYISASRRLLKTGQTIIPVGRGSNGYRSERRRALGPTADLAVSLSHFLAGRRRHVLRRLRSVCRR